MRRQSHTAIKIAQRCLRKYWYRYHARLEPIERPAHLERGSNLHKLFELQYKGEPWETDNPDDAFLMERYIAHYEKEDAGFDVIAVEEDFVMTIWGYEIVFKPDLVVAINGETWIVDHKTTTRIPDEWNPYNMTDLQHLLYVEGMKQNGYDIAGFMFNYVRTKPPRIPRLIKDGSRIADVRRIDTDFHTLKEFAEEHGMESHSDVKERLNILANTPNAFFQRHFLLRNDAAVSEAVFDTGSTLHLLEMAEDIQYYPRHVLPGWAGSASCSNCEFQEICSMDAMGFDTSNLTVLGLQQRPVREK